MPPLHGPCHNVRQVDLKPHSQYVTTLFKKIISILLHPVFTTWFTFLHCQLAFLSSFHKTNIFPLKMKKKFLLLCLFDCQGTTLQGKVWFYVDHLSSKTVRIITTKTKSTCHSKLSSESQHDLWLVSCWLLMVSIPLNSVSRSPNVENPLPWQVLSLVSYRPRKKQTINSLPSKQEAGSEEGTVG